MTSWGFKGGDALRKYLADIAQRTGDGEVLRVGFLEGATYPDGTSVPMVAAIQNFGAPAANIPPRPFFTNMVREKSPDWGKSLGNLLKDNQYNAEAALLKMGEGIKGQLQEAITDTNSPELSEGTIKAKGFSKPLIDTGHMQNSVDYDVKS